MMGVINTLFTRRNRSKTVTDCQRSLCELKCDLSIYRQEVTTYDMRELQKYVKSSIINEHKTIQLDKVLVKQKVVDHYLKVWSKEWEQLNSCRVTKQFFGKPNVGLDLQLFNNKQIQTLIQASTCHGLFKAHLAHMGKVGPECNLCGAEKQTSFYLWAECHALEEVREKYIYDDLPYEHHIVQFFSDGALIELGKQYE